MIRLIEYGSTEQQEIHERAYGRDSDSPSPNFKEITEKEFAQSKFFSYGADRTEYRQILPDRLPWKGEKYALSVTLYYLYDGTGYGISSDYWQGKVRYFRFAACEHEYKELSQQECRKRGLYHAGRCYHVSECVKCGRINAVDSSD